ncbi:MAG: metal-dependent hydrolase [Planctomycetota bacterium]
MADFKTHVTTSSVCGVGYAAAGFWMGVPVESALIAGGLCGVGGMLPDIDSDSGIPFRESMALAAAVAPMMMLPRLQSLGLNNEQIVLAGMSSYLFVRFVVAKMIAKYTVHRGMFHSIPAILIFGGIVFLLSNTADLHLRYFKACGVMLGVLSHLTLDEIYSVDVRGLRLKKSAGTALKLWGKSTWSNVSAYGKLLIIVVLILGEPMVMERYGERPVMTAAKQYMNGGAPVTEGIDPNALAAGVVPPAEETGVEGDQNIYDTARRIWRRFKEQR